LAPLARRDFNRRTNRASSIDVFGKRMNVNQCAVDGANYRIYTTNRLAANDTKRSTEPWCLTLESDHQAALMGLFLDRP